MRLVWEQYPEPVMIDLGKSQFGDEGGGGGGGELGPGGGCVDRGSKKQMEIHTVLLYLPGSNLISIYVSVLVQTRAKIYSERTFL